MSQYIRDRWGVEQGLPRGPIYAITQTADGYLWIGAEAGLIRFDGWKFDLVPQNSGAFQIVSVLGLLPDKDGNLWVRLQGPRMLRYRGGVFEDALAKVPFANITATAMTMEGRLLASAPERGAVTYQDGEFRMVAPATVLPRSPVISIAQTTPGEVWMGTRDAGLFRMTGDRVAAVSSGLPDPKVNCLLAGDKGDLWVGTDNGAAYWSGSELRTLHTGAPQRRLQVLAMEKDRDGNLWLGTNSRGLLRVNSQGVSALPASPAATGDAVTAVFEDREGNLWLGSANGLERLRDSAFRSYSQPEGLPSDGSNPLHVDEESRLWFPSLEGGLWWTKDERRGRLTADGLDSDVVYSISGRQGELWLGRQRGGLSRLATANNRFAMRTYTVADGLAESSVIAVQLARDGTVWAGTLRGGVSRLQGGKFTTYTTRDGLTSNTIESILESSNGAIWLATPGGLSMMGNGSWKSYSTDDGLPSLHVNCLLEDSLGVIWAGTSKGLAYGGSSGFQTPREAPASLREPIMGMAEDDHGSLWVSTSNHVIRVKRKKLMEGTREEGDVQEYGIADGLRSVEGVKRHRSVVRDGLGRIWFSMNRGISMVDPRRLAIASAPAIVHIQSVTADGVPLKVGSSIRIGSGKQRITFGFAGLSLPVPERVRFRYTLENFDSTWSEPVSAREVMYTNLVPGAYRFRVIASNMDGVWNSAEANIALEIDPVFWQTWWFRLGVATACGLSILALYHMRLQRMTGQLALRYEERLAERTRIAQELHDTLLQGFLSASMQLHVAAELVPEEFPAKQSLDRVQQLMGRVIEEGRNAVRGLRSQPSGTEDLEQAFLLLRQELGEQHATELRVIVEGQVRELRPVLRDEVYRIGREALMNAFRHSQANHIEMQIEYTARHFRVLVRDDGCGIDPGVVRSGLDGHWGLPGMRERAEGIGAQFHVWSSSSAGTEVELTVPGRVAFVAQSPVGLAAWLSNLYPRTKNRKNGRKQ